MITGRAPSIGRVLTGSQRSFFRSNGYLVVEQAVPDEFLAGVQRELEAIVDDAIARWQRTALITEDYADIGFGSRYHVAWLAAGRPPSTTTEADNCSIAEAFADYVTQGWLVDLVADLIGAEGVAPIDSCFYRTRFPGDASTGLPWHQDAPCVKPIAGIDFVGVWIPLVDVSEESSCLEVSPVGEGQGMFEAVWSDRLGYVFMRDTDVATLRDVRAIRMRRGDLLLLSPFLPHRSLDNHGPTIRWSVDFRYSPI